MLTKNLDKNGRMIRLIIAILLLAFAAWQHSWLALLIALFVFFEAYMSWCVIYQIFGINQCPIETKHEKKSDDETS